MHRVWQFSIAALISTAALGTFTDRGGASEWGCEVLLCASSSEPSWRSIPACHPPMHRLISAMNGWGFSWPTCPEAGTGKPGYEAYDDCPAGWSAVSSYEDQGGRPQEICVQVRNICNSRSGGRDGCEQTVTMPRPLRQDPYYFDIRHDDGNVTRHWFSLTR
jgi:hypothetical protein